MSNGYIEVLHEYSQNDQTPEQSKEILFREFEKKLPGAVERLRKLPPLNLNGPFGIYLDLLYEARDLFVFGYFYSCVAMCGIAGERIIKDELRASVLIKRNDQPQIPDYSAFDKLEQCNVSNILYFLNKAGVLSDDVKDTAQKLGGLRNKYAHACGEKPEEDAFKAIENLYKIIEGTVSISKNFEENDGMLFKKDKAPK